MIAIQMVGIDHSKAELEYRELFSFTKASAVAAMQRLKAELGVPGSVILSTCNRTELWLSESVGRAPEELLCTMKGVAAAEYEPYFVRREGSDAVRHLLTTACGMNSKVFGEDQIITQVGDALALAHDCGCADSVLERLFRTAVTAAKRVKTSVRLTALDTSVAVRTAELAAAELGGLQGVRCLVIGGGEMGRLTAAALQERGAEVSITLRQYKSGAAIIPKGCATVHYDDRFAALERARVVVSATTSPHHTLKLEDTLPHLDGTPKLLIDLAVPRDISTRLSGAAGITLYNIDSLGGVAAEEAANSGVVLANQILEEYLEEFCDWYDFRELVPAIHEISTLAATDITTRIHKTIRQLEVDDREQEHLRQMVEASSIKVVGKLLFGLREHLDRSLWQVCVEGIEKAAKE